MRSKALAILPMTLLTAALAISATFCGGCAKVARPVVADLGSDDQDTQIEFWHTLATKSVCSNDDAFHALLLDIDGTDPNPDYNARVAALKKRGLVLNWFSRPANEGVTRGTVAVALCKAGGIKGGITMHFFPIERYCLRELVYINMLPPSSENQTFSGLELVGVIGRFEDFQRGNPADLPASEMPPAPNDVRGNPNQLKTAPQS